MAWSLVGSDAIAFADGGAGHSYALPSGAPSAGNLDILCINSNTVLASNPAGFTLLATFVGNQGSYLYSRFATGGEGSSVVITTSGNFATKLGWSRWAGGQAFDTAAVAHVDTSSGSSSPAVTTGALAGPGELVIGFAALHNIAAPCTSPLWSTGYSGLTSLASDIGSSQVGQFVGYRIDGGPAAESPSVSWSGGTPFNRYILVAAFTPNLAVASVPGSITPVTRAGIDTPTSSAGIATATSRAGLLTATSAGGG